MSNEFSSLSVGLISISKLGTHQEDLNSLRKLLPISSILSERMLEKLRKRKNQMEMILMMMIKLLLVEAREVGLDRLGGKRRILVMGSLICKKGF